MLSITCSTFQDSEKLLEYVKAVEIGRYTYRNIKKAKKILQLLQRFTCEAAQLIKHNYSCRTVCRDIAASDPEFSCTSEVEKYVQKELGNNPTITVLQ